MDETVTAWVIRDDFFKTFTIALNSQGWSTLYFILIHGWTQLFGLNEIALRSFSLCAFVVGCVFLYLILRKKFSPEIAVFGTIFSSAILIFHVTGLEARPYCLASAFSIGSYYFFFNWLEGRGRKARVLHIVFAVATIYTHWLYGTLLLVQTLLIFLIKMSDRRSYIRKWLINLLIIGVLCSPNLYQFALIFQSRVALDWVSPPSLLTWLKFTFPFASTFCLLIICYLIFKRRLSLLTAYFNELIAGIIWLIIPTAFLFIFSLIFNASVLHFRYSGANYAGLGLIIASLISCIPKSSFRSFIMYTISICMIFFTVAPVTMKVHYFTESWREPVAFLGKLQQENKKPILLSSGLIGANSRKLTENHIRYDDLSAPVQYYLPDQHVLTIPDARHLSFLDAILANAYETNALQDNGFYLLVHGTAYDKKKSCDIFKKYFSDRCFYPKIEKAFNNIYVLEFQYQSSSARSDGKVLKHGRTNETNH